MWFNRKLLEGITLATALSGCGTTFLRVPPADKQIADIVQGIREGCGGGQEKVQYAVQAGCIYVDVGFSPNPHSLPGEGKSVIFGTDPANIERDLKLLRERFQRACEADGGKFLLVPVFDCSEQK